MHLPCFLIHVRIYIHVQYDHNVYIHVHIQRYYLQASYGGGQELVAQLSGVHQHEPQVLVDRAVFGSDVLQAVAAQPQPVELRVCTHGVWEERERKRERE